MKWLSHMKSRTHYVYPKSYNSAELTPQPPNPEGKMICTDTNTKAGPALSFPSFLKIGKTKRPPKPLTQLSPHQTANHKPDAYNHSQSPHADKYIWISPYVYADVKPPTRAPKDNPTCKSTCKYPCLHALFLSPQP